MLNLAWTKRLSAGAGRGLRRFKADDAGVSAVEFALILPVMLICFLGTVEVTQAVRANSKVASTADTVGNLVTRLKSVDNTAMTNIFAISSAVMNPFSIDDLDIMVTAVRVDADGKGSVAWSKAMKGPTPPPGSNFPVPSDLTGFKNTYFVVSKATYAYKPLGTYGDIVRPMTFEHSNQFRPRKSTEITLK